MRRLRLLLQRQVDRESRSFTDFAFHADGAVVVVYDSPYDGQSEARSVLALGGVERLEQPGQVLFRYALAGVRYPHLQIILVACFVHRRPFLPIALGIRAALELSVRRYFEAVNRRSAFGAVTVLLDEGDVALRA